MNRELKFRVWYYDQKKFDKNLELGDFKRYSFPLYWCCVQQYTGLKDKNGKDIYEGDILKWHEGDHELSEVVFQNGSFFVKGVNWGALWYIGDYNDSYEIVGNVFETPELLK